MCKKSSTFAAIFLEMTRKTIYHIIEWGVALAACGYLVWRLATYDDYASLGATLRAMGRREWLALGLCVALMPVNMGIEAWRWRSLMDGLMSFREAQRQVYYSKLAGVITPWRLGEYPARAVLMSERMNEGTNERMKEIWAKVLSMGAVGSATMTAAIVVEGLVSLGVLGILGSAGTINYGSLATQAYWIMVGTVMVALVVGLALAPRLLRRWATVSHRLIMVSFGQSMVRLVCWCVQLMLVLWALGAVSDQWLAVSGEWLLNLPIYYLLVTVTPNVPLAEVGVRGAWAIVVFGTVNAALAGVLLWGINTLLPCVVWPFIRKGKR